MTKLPQRELPLPPAEPERVSLRASWPWLLVYSLLISLLAFAAAQLVGVVVALTIGERTVLGAIVQILTAAVIVGTGGYRADPIITRVRRDWHLG